MPITTRPSPRISPDLKNLPKVSLVRLYEPATSSNGFWLDGFPALKAGTDWVTRLVDIVENWGAVAMTTNQTIFRQLVETGVLDGRLRELKRQGRGPEEIYQTLYNEAATAAARVFAEVHARWPTEGRVSQEASAFLTELEPLVREVQRIAQLMAGVGSFAKIPNLKIGPQAIERAISSPDVVVNPNITLVFSDKHYLDTVEGYLLGLQARAANLKKRGVAEAAIRNDLSAIRSVNSLFVSRVDRVLDPMIDEAAQRPADSVVRQKLLLLKGKVAVAQAKVVSRMFSAIFLGESFADPEGLYADAAEGKPELEKIQKLQRMYAALKTTYGVVPQRLLIASSGVKSDQPYSPLLYVLPFLGPWSANTMPEGTLAASSQFVATLSDAQVAALKKRNLMREPLPAIPSDVQPIARWDEALLMTAQERKQAGIDEITPDQILRETRDQILKPQGTTLRAICDTLRDKGAASFTADEEATLAVLRNKLSTV